MICEIGENRSESSLSVHWSLPFTCLQFSSFFRVQVVVSAVGQPIPIVMMVVCGNAITINSVDTGLNEHRWLYAAFKSG